MSGLNREDPAAASEVWESLESVGPLGTGSAVALGVAYEAKVDIQNHDLNVRLRPTTAITPGSIRAIVAHGGGSSSRRRAEAVEGNPGTFTVLLMVSTPLPRKDLTNRY